MRTKICTLIMLLSIGLCQATNTMEKNKSTVILRHSLDKYLGEQLKNIVDKFNTSQDKVAVILEYGGNYTESFEKTFQEADPSKRPHLLLVSEYNTRTMFDKKGQYVPVDEIINIKKSHFTPVIQAFYSFKVEGIDQPRMMSMPFACSTAALYYNKDAFRKAGLDPSYAPATWEELEEASKKLIKAGYKGFATAWRPAYMLEHFATVHNIPFADPQNGFDIGPVRLKVDEKPYVDQLNRFKGWEQAGIYVDFKKNEEAEEAFAQGIIPILMQGANRETILKNQISKAHQNFEIGVGSYPYSAALTKEPYALNIGGTSLWVLAGHEEDRKNIADFLDYLASPEVQAEWHQKTAYLPITLDAYELTKKSGFYVSHPAHAIACQQVIERKANLPNGLRIPNYGLIRERLTGAIDNIMAGNDAKAELKAAVEQTAGMQ